MKTHLSTLLTATAVLTGTISPASAPEPKFKAAVPQRLIPPDKVQTEFLGELNFTDGMPSEDMVKKTYDFLDRSRAVASFLNGIPCTSIYVTVAFALPADLLDPERFGVTVATHLGMKTNAFSTKSEALVWLEAQPIQTSPAPASGRI